MYMISIYTAGAVHIDIGIHKVAVHIDVDIHTDVDIHVEKAAVAVYMDIDIDKLPAVAVYMDIDIDKLPVSARRLYCHKETSIII
jgi:hypothetical protein